MEVLGGETEDTFAKGEAIKFDCFPSGSTFIRRSRLAYTSVGVSPSCFDRI